MTLRFAALWLMLAGLLAGVVLALSVAPAPLIELMGEQGPVERLTGIGFFLLVPLVWLLRRRGDPLATLTALSAVFLAFGAREMDWHKAWTGTSVLRVSYYAGPAPMQHKLVALAVLAVVLLALGRLVLRHARPIWQALRRGEPVAVSVAVFIATIVLAKGLDRSYSILTEDFGWPLTIGVQAAIVAVEECLELTLILIALLGLWQNRARSAETAS